MEEETGAAATWKRKQRETLWLDLRSYRNIYTLCHADRVMEAAS